MIVYGGEIVLTKKASGYSVKLRVTHGIIDLGDLKWSYQATYNSFVAAISDLYNVDTTNYARGLLCSNYVTSNKWWTDSNKPDDTISHASSNQIAIKDTTYSDKDTFKAAMVGVKLVYELATPIEIDLTDASDIVALVGVNNVWSDTNGEMEISFKQGIQEYIDAKIAEVQALVL